MAIDRDETDSDPMQASSSTDQVLTELQLHGYRPRRQPEGRRTHRRLLGRLPQGAADRLQAGLDPTRQSCPDAGYHAALGLAQIGIPAEGWRQAIAVIGAIAVAAVAWARIVLIAPPDTGGASLPASPVRLTSAAHDG